MRIGRDEAGTAFERERKFSLPDGAAMPDLGVLGPVSPMRTLRLRAEYFDTPAGALARAGLTLRRRSGGEDDGWHLKTPGPNGSRLEHSLPLGAPCRVPASLRATVADVVGEDPLLPVLLLRTRRRITHLFGESGRIRTEIAVDRVRARPLGELSDGTRSWCEVEVELATGEPESTLDEVSSLLLRSGLRPAVHASKAQLALASCAGRGTARDTAAHAVTAELARHFGQFQALDTALVTDEDDAVHQARVALRRLRSILTVFGRTLAAPDLPGLVSELRWAGVLLGGPRDTEVILALIDDLAGEVGLSVDDHARIRVHLARRHDDARGLLLNSMATPRWDALHERMIGHLLRAKASRSGRRHASLELRRLADRADDRVRRRLQLAQSHPGDVSLWHDVRKAAKAARYAHDVVAGLPGSRSADEECASAWKDVTSAFGDVQDLVIARREVGLLGGPTVGTLMDLADRRADSALAEARAALLLALPARAPDLTP
ncbi:CYTH and CHAD domain-containing protein [Tessaracoccus sp. MC1627]|uniref:CYTH and CHAD domain-containing protein n=1 Tax=Tessaracoccus sp. MC1627 TaxID=2760312 RepID=UPI001601EE90|nr:CYTH and CHAD domain-containing protein [Tessaracoccus sp. MC1627]MBB1512803.1 CYTH and CHAD domain-containing protein [Tessaracoccus sp. MC1627]